MSTSPAGLVDVGARVDALLQTLQDSRAAAAQRFGPLSKAAYVVTFAAFTSLFRIHLDCLGTPEQARVASRLDVLRQQLHSMFRQMTQPPRVEVTRSANELAGKACDLLRFEAEHEQAQAGRRALAGAVCPLQQALRAVVPPATLLYCLTERDRLMVYLGSLSYQDMMAGAVRDGVTVKHTMLVEHDEAVVCAGEIHLATSSNGDLGAFCTSASGHFQPEPATELLVRDHLIRRLAMRPEAISLLSHPGDSR